MALIPRASTPAPKLSQRRANSGRIITKPVICRAIQSARATRMAGDRRVGCVLIIWPSESFKPLAPGNAPHYSFYSFCGTINIPQDNSRVIVRTWRSGLMKRDRGKRGLFRHLQDEPYNKSSNAAQESWEMHSHCSLFACGERGD